MKDRLSGQDHVEGVLEKKVIQVPFDNGLLARLDALAEREALSRAEVIRRACRAYLERKEEQAMDEEYRQGYLRIPESPALAEAQASLTGAVLLSERW